MFRIPISLGNSLRGKLAWLLSAAIILSAAIQAGLIYRVTLSELGEVFDYQMRQVALTLQGGMETAPQPPAPQSPDREDHLDFVIQIWTVGGEPRFQSPAGARLPFPSATGFSSATVQGSHYRVFSLRTATRVIQVAQDRASREEMAAALALQTVVPILLLAPMLLAAVWILVRRSTRPILKTKAQIADREAEDLSPLSSTGLPDEVKPLVDEINLLFTRLGKVFAAQRDFVADAAHELRTPLAALRLQVQSLQRADGEEARLHAARRLLEGVDRATRLVEQMLVLARQEAPAEPSGADGIVELAAIAGVAIGECHPSAQLKGVDLGMAEGPGIELCGQPEALRILVRNLLENAIKFTPVGGTVDLTLRTEGHWAVLTIEDSGPGIPPAEWARVFDRFYRLPGQTVSGSGLGLAIVKTIAERHLGRVVLDRSARLGGLAISVFLPMNSGQN